MDKEYVMQIAQTIKMQLVSMTPMPVFMSWGVTDGFIPDMSLSRSTVPIITKYIY